LYQGEQNQQQHTRRSNAQFEHELIEDQGQCAPESHSNVGRDQMVVIAQVIQVEVQIRGEQTFGPSDLLVELGMHSKDTFKI
jgi:hypothetical protein